MRFKKTEVCQTCAKLKNICQTCLLDLEYGLPVQVRDSALNIKEDMPKDLVNREYYSQNLDREMANQDPSLPGGALGKSQATSDLLLKLARTTPYYKRNRPHICSFWVKGECKRGEECPYRHEKPTDPDDPLADQNIKDRFHGVNDPVANKLLARAATMPKLEPPEDKNITTLYLGGLNEKITEKDIRDNFYQYGEIRTVSLIPKQQCAFIQFVNRSSAEMAAEKAFNKLIIKGRRVVIKWGKSQGQQAQAEAITGDDVPALQPVPGLPVSLPPPPQEVSNDFFNLVGSSAPMMPPYGSVAPAPPMGHIPRPPSLPPPGIRMMGMRPPMGLRPFMPPSPMNMRLPPGPPPGMPPPGARMHLRPPSMPGIHYPSQDPLRLGSTMPPPTNLQEANQAAGT